MIETRSPFERALWMARNGYGPVRMSQVTKVPYLICERIKKHCGTAQYQPWQDKKIIELLQRHFEMGAA